MSYDEIEIEDMTWNEEMQAYQYACPCGDKFQITLDDLRSCEEIARCPSCSLYITVIYDPEDFQGDKPLPHTLKAKVPLSESVTHLAKLSLAAAEQGPAEAAGEHGSSSESTSSTEEDASQEGQAAAQQGSKQAVQAVEESAAAVAAPAAAAGALAVWIPAT